MSEGFILTQPDQIRAFGLMQVRSKLRMEVERPNGPTWRDRPSVQARNLLIEAGRPDPGRTKKKILAAYEAYLAELGL